MSVSVLFGIGVLYFSFSPEDDAKKKFSLVIYKNVISSGLFECTDVTILDFVDL